MGNHAATGHVVAMTGLQDAFGFQKTLETLVVQNGIQPWAPERLADAKLGMQYELSKRSPLRFINAVEGLRFYSQHVGSMLNPLSRERFVQVSQEFFRLKGLHCPPEEACLFYDVFDAINMYQNASLSIGEIAALVSFFGGSVDERTQAIFELFDRSHTGRIPKDDLKALVQPYLWAIVPNEAAVLRPVLLPHVADEIFADITGGHAGSVELAQLTRWVIRGQQMQASNANPLFSAGLFARVAQIVNFALQATWRDHHAKTQLRSYGQQTWAQQHDGQTQRLMDVGAYRYVSNAVATTQPPSNTWNQLSQHSATVYQSVADTSGQLYQSGLDYWSSRARADTAASVVTTRSRADTMRSRAGTIEIALPPPPPTAQQLAQWPPVAPQPTPQFQTMPPPQARQIPQQMSQQMPPPQIAQSPRQIPQQMSQQMPPPQIAQSPAFQTRVLPQQMPQQIPQQGQVATTGNLFGTPNLGAGMVRAPVTTQLGGLYQTQYPTPRVA
jgi:Ca2+-binding EF-hand superfamily protein